MAQHGTVLVIDDEEIMREILDALLAREGYAVRLAADANEGLELARAIPFDAAIVDVMLPGMDGIAVLDELKKFDEELPIANTGDLDLNIIIRTFLVKDGVAHVQVGAGIVADSDPGREHAETLQKAEALAAALEKL